MYGGIHLHVGKYYNHIFHIIEIIWLLSLYGFVLNTYLIYWPSFLGICGASYWRIGQGIINQQ